MKNIALIIAFFALVPLASFAGGDDDELLNKSLILNIGGASSAIEGSAVDGLSLYIEASEKEVAKAWKSFLSDRYHLKLKKSGGWLKGEEAFLTDIWTANNTTVHCKVNGSGSGAILEVFVDLGGTFLTGSAHSAANDQLKSQMKSFARSLYTEKLGKVLKKKSKSQKKANKELGKLSKKRNKQEKAIVKANRNVQKANRSIDKAQQRIAKAEAGMEKMKGEITKEEEVAKTTAEQKLITEGEIEVQQKTVGEQNKAVKLVLDKMEEVKKL
jgi:hypothetical protein